MGSLFGSKPKQVGPTQAEIEAASRPYGLMGPTGGITWDYENKMGTATLSPEMMALADRLFGRAEETAGMTGITPEDYYRQFVEQDLLEQQERERLATESRLLGQGILGATTGANIMEGLFRAQSAEQRAGRADAFTQSQAYADALRQREMADIAAAASIYESPATLFQTGAGVGQGLGNIMASYRPTYTAGSSGLLGGILPAVAGGIVSGGMANLGKGVGFFGGKAPAPSDSRLKENVKKVGTTKSGINLYSWKWNSKAKELGLDWGSNIGVMAQEIKDIIPEAVIMADDGYYRVDYSKVV